MARKRVLTKEKQIIELLESHIYMLPHFNPAWPIEVQQAWYAAFNSVANQLVARL